MTENGWTFGPPPDVLWIVEQHEPMAGEWRAERSPVDGAVPYVRALKATTNLTIRAEMTRRGLLTSQLMPYEDPECGNITPKAGMTADAWDFIHWLEGKVSEL